MPATLLVSETRRLAASPESVWRVLGHFGNEHRWTRAVVACTRDTPDVRVGTTRVCHLPKPVMGRTEARETLVEYAPGRALAYELHGSAGPFAKAGSRWSQEPAPDGGTRVTVEGRFVPKNAMARILAWPLARLYVRRLIQSTLAELDAHLEARPPSEGA